MSGFFAELGHDLRAAAERSARVDGPVIGLVVDDRDPLALGRVRLRFPTLPGGDASAWAPTSGLGAGPDRGWWMPPAIDDEVLVVFEHGDVGRPVVLGALWNGVDRPPEGGGHLRILRSRSGCQVVLDERTGSITIEDGAGHGRIVLDGDGGLTIDAPDGDVDLHATDGELRVAAAALDVVADRVLVHADGDLALSAASVRVAAAAISLSAPRLDLGERPPR